MPTTAVATRQKTHCWPKVTGAKGREFQSFSKHVLAINVETQDETISLREHRTPLRAVGVNTMPTGKRVQRSVDARTNTKRTPFQSVDPGIDLQGMMRVYKLKIIVALSLVVFLGGMGLQFSLFQKIDRHTRNATALEIHDSSQLPRKPQPTAPLKPSLGRCAINLYGLPRAFESLVLPSLIKNVIRTNAGYHCDYFVHYYNLTHEDSGRSGAGGVLDPHEVRHLTHAVKRYDEDGKGQVAVEYTFDEEEYFWTRYKPLLNRIHNTTDKNGKYLYFPWKAVTYKYPITVDNIIKMWHSIEQAWNLMEAHAKKEKIQYSRVAMLRSDVVYMTPIDIWETERSGVRDTENKVAVIPGFGKHPVSDRIIYGPHDAVSVWASNRFRSLDTHVRWIAKNRPGWGMHSEKFVNFTLLPAIRETGARVAEHETMCFFRSRSDETVWINDCDGPPEVSSREIRKHMNLDRRQAVEDVLGRKCPGQVYRITRMFSALDCKRDSAVQDTQ